MSWFRPTKAIVDLDALVENAKHLQGLLPAESFFCPMVKANAYGHGAVRVVRALEKRGFRRFGVSLVEEALELREAGFQGEILVFGGFGVPASEWVRAGLTMVASQWDQLRLIESQLDSKSEAVLDLHLKFDTGMNRLGFPVAEAGKLAEHLRQSSRWRLRGVLTHLHSSDTSVEATEGQLESFASVIPVFSEWKPAIHVWNTQGLQGLERWSASTRAWGARPGLGIYGGAGLKPVLSFRSALVEVRRVARGQTLSYGATWKAPRDSVIGIVTAGYADGYPWRASNKSQVLVAGRSTPVVGRVCMDFMMVDLTQHPVPRPLEAWKGEEVLLWGKDEEGQSLRASELARVTETSEYEVFTGLSPRVPIHYFESDVESL